MHHTSLARTVALLIAYAAIGMHASAQLQSVLSTAGYYFGNASGSIAFTIGEPVVATQTTGGVIITQGFHQPEAGLITVVSTALPPADISVFPIPSRDDVFVTLAGPQNGWTCTLYDLYGKILIRETLLLQSTALHLSSFANGAYVLHVADAQGQLVRTFQLIIAK